MYVQPDKDLRRRPIRITVDPGNEPRDKVDEVLTKIRDILLSEDEGAYGTWIAVYSAQNPENGPSKQRLTLIPSA